MTPEQLHVYTEEKDGPKKMAIQPLVEELSRLNGYCAGRMDKENPFHIIQPKQ
jgi:hypothetical protein